MAKRAADDSCSSDFSGFISSESSEDYSSESSNDYRSNRVLTSSQLSDTGSTKKKATNVGKRVKRNISKKSKTGSKRKTVAKPTVDPYKVKGSKWPKFLNDIKYNYRLTDIELLDDDSDIPITLERIKNFKKNNRKYFDELLQEFGSEKILIQPRFGFSVKSVGEFKDVTTPEEFYKEGGKADNWRNAYTDINILSLEVIRNMGFQYLHRRYSMEVHPSFDYYYPSNSFERLMLPEELFSDLNKTYESQKALFTQRMNVSPVIEKYSRTEMKTTFPDCKVDTDVQKTPKCLACGKIGSFPGSALCGNKEDVNRGKRASQDRKDWYHLSCIRDQLESQIKRNLCYSDTIKCPAIAAKQHCTKKVDLYFHEKRLNQNFSQSTAHLIQCAECEEYLWKWDAKRHECVTQNNNLQLAEDKGNVFVTCGVNTGSEPQPSTSGCQSMIKEEKADTTSTVEETISTIAESITIEEMTSVVSRTDESQIMIESSDIEIESSEAVETPLHVTRKYAKNFGHKLSCVKNQIVDLVNLRESSRKRIAELERELTDKTRVISEKEKSLNESQITIGRLQMKGAEVDKTLETLRKQINDCENEKKKFIDVLNEKETHINGLKEELEAITENQNIVETVRDFDLNELNGVYNQFDTKFKAFVGTFRAEKKEEDIVDNPVATNAVPPTNCADLLKEPFQEPKSS